MGDLVESAFKRWAGAKDSGAFLPGMGGALDVMDSFLVSVPLTFLLLQLPK
jgi:phosphatidate cytidylyltransferase